MTTIIPKYPEIFLGFCTTEWKKSLQKSLWNKWEKMILISFSLSDLVYTWFLFLKLELRGRDRDDLIFIVCLCIYMLLVYIDFGLPGSMLGGSHDMISHYMQPLCSLGPINSFCQVGNLGIGGSVRWTKSFYLVSVWTRIWTQIWKKSSQCMSIQVKKKENSTVTKIIQGSSCLGAYSFSP